MILFLFVTSCAFVCNIFQPHNQPPNKNRTEKKDDDADNDDDDDNNKFQHI